MKFPAWLIVFLSRIVLPMIGLLIIAIKIIMKNGKDISQKLFGVNFQSAIVPSTEKTTGHGNPAPEDSETGRNSNMMGNQTHEEIEAERLSNIKARTATMRLQFRENEARVHPMSRSNVLGAKTYKSQSSQRKSKEKPSQHKGNEKLQTFFHK